MPHRLPRRLLVRGIPDHHRRIRVDQLTGQPPVRRGAQPLDRNQPEQTPRSIRRRCTHRDVVHRGERMTPQPCPHAGHVVAGRTREHVRHHVLVQRSRQQIVRGIGGSESAHGSPAQCPTRRTIRHRPLCTYQRDESPYQGTTMPPRTLSTAATARRESTTPRRPIRRQAVASRMGQREMCLGDAGTAEQGQQPDTGMVGRSPAEVTRHSGPFESAAEHRDDRTQPQPPRTDPFVPATAAHPQSPWPLGSIAQHDLTIQPPHPVRPGARTRLSAAPAPTSQRPTTNLAHSDSHRQAGGSPAPGVGVQSGPHPTLCVAAAFSPRGLAQRTRRRPTDTHRRQRPWSAGGVPRLQAAHLPTDRGFAGHIPHVRIPRIRRYSDPPPKIGNTGQKNETPLINQITTRNPFTNR